MSQFTFPKDFIWGTATASYQVEGAVDADGRGTSTWDTFSRRPGKITNNDNGDIACDHYHLYKEDTAVMKSLNQNAYRFSIAWPRIMPEGEGKINQKGLDHYRRMIDHLLEAGIEPFITLFHWDYPYELFLRGGWLSPESPRWFADYVEVVVDRLSDRVDHWITLNEPWEYACLGHLLGYHAPGRHNPWTYFRVAHHQLLGHGLALQRIRSISPEAHVGTTLSMSPILPATNRSKDVQAALIGDQFFNGFFFEGSGGNDTLVFKDAAAPAPKMVTSSKIDPVARTAVIKGTTAFGASGRLVRQSFLTNMVQSNGFLKKCSGNINNRRCCSNASPLCEQMRLFLRMWMSSDGEAPHRLSQSSRKK